MAGSAGGSGARAAAGTLFSRDALARAAAAGRGAQNGCGLHPSASTVLACREDDSAQWQPNSCATQNAAGGCSTGRSDKNLEQLATICKGSAHTAGNIRMCEVAC